MIEKSETVLVNDPSVPSNGATEHAAIVTAVHSETPNPLINAKIFPDGGQFYNGFSIYHRDERPANYNGQTWCRRGDLELPEEHRPTNADEAVDEAEEVDESEDDGEAA